MSAEADEVCAQPEATVAGTGVCRSRDLCDFTLCKTLEPFCILVAAVPHGAYPGLLVRVLDSDHPRNGLESTLG